MMRTDARLTEVEAAVRVLRARVISLEQQAGIQQPHAAPAPAPPPPAAVPAGPPPAPRVQPARPAPRAPRVQRVHAPPRLPSARDLEDLVGGRLLAWVGGASVLLGLAFFFALAVSNGWIGEGMRTLLAGAGSLGLLGLGVWLRERRSRNEAAMAAAATGLAGLFLTIVVAAQAYELIPALPALLLGLITAATGTYLALRWNAQVIGGLAILGGALAPALAGAEPDATTISLLLVATAGGAAVLVHKQWSWLAIALFACVTPQWAPWEATNDSVAGVMLALTGFGAAGAVAAIGFEFRSATERLRNSAAFLLAANALVLGAVGWAGFHSAGAPDLANLLLAVLAASHIAAGGSMRLEQRISRDFSVVALAIGLVLADVAWAAFADGPAVAIGWALSAIVFAWAASHGSLRRVERQAAVAGLGGQIAIAIGHVLTSDVPPSAVAGTASADGIVALASLAAACLISGRFAEDGRDELRMLLDGLGLAAVAYLTACVMDGAPLVAALAGEACVLAQVARVRRDQLAGTGAFAFLGLAAGHALVVEAPPEAFLYGAPAPGALGLALGAVVLATIRLASVIDLRADHRMALIAGAAVTALYGASVAIVTAFQPGAEAAGSALLDIGVRQQGQMLVSGLWSLVGAGALIAGLTGDRGELRIGGLALLVAAVGKVFLFDLSTLTSVYRVISFVGVGLVLLTGAYAWQRLRPAPLPDLREAS